MNDEHAATELRLYIDNDAELYRQQHVPIIKNLMTKKARGEYAHDRAVKAFGYLVESGAKKFAKEFASPGEWNKIFSVPTRRAVSEDLTEAFEAAAVIGVYDDLLPKKYQRTPEVKSSGRAAPVPVRKKSPAQLSREIAEVLGKPPSKRAR